MNLRDRAASDIDKIMTSEGGPGDDFFLIAPSGGCYKLRGIYGDIGYVLNFRGEAFQGRTIEAAYGMAQLEAQTKEEPARGWQFKTISRTGEAAFLFVARYEPDRTAGVARLKLALDLTVFMDEAAEGE